MKLDLKWFASESSEEKIEKKKHFGHKKIIGPRPFGGARRVRPPGYVSVQVSIPVCWSFVTVIPFQERDIDRTVGINTGHVGTSDFVLEKEDRDFVVEVRYI